MADTSFTELAELALAAGRHLAGDAIRKVAVEPGDDWAGDPKYDFWFLLDTELLPPGQGQLMIDLRIRLIDELDARGDVHHPFVHFTNAQDWAKRGRA